MFGKLMVGCVAVAVALTGSLSAIPAQATESDSTAEISAPDVAPAETRTTAIVSPLRQTIDIGEGTGPGEMAFSPDGKLAYVLGSGDGSLNIVDLTAGALKKKIDIGWGYAAHIAVNSAGTIAYITVGTSFYDTHVVAFDLESETTIYTKNLGGPSLRVPRAYLANRR